MLHSQIIDAIDNLLVEIDNVKDLKQKMELLNYLAQHVDYSLWSVEEEARQLEHADDY